jgi:hypothetical protein
LEAGVRRERATETREREQSTKDSCACNHSFTTTIPTQEHIIARGVHTGDITAKQQWSKFILIVQFICHMLG